MFLKQMWFRVTKQSKTADYAADMVYGKYRCSVYGHAACCNKQNYNLHKNWWSVSVPSY